VLQQAHGAVAASSREHAGDGRVAQSSIQLCQPALVAAGQVTVFIEDS
jgi:hypothetical protein